MRRFYSPFESISGGFIELDEASTKHLRGVLRLTAGDHIAVFDGKGNEYQCKIDKIERSRTLAEILSKIDPPSPESPLDLTLAAALTKNDKFDLIIQKAAELGVNSLIPLITQRCDIKVKDSGTRHERWQRIALEASKQSGRAVVMHIEEIVSYNHLISGLENYGTVPILFSERQGTSLEDVRKSSNIVAIVGPEGGWDDKELDLARKNRVDIVTLGGRILRAETAAIVTSAILQHRFGDVR